MSDQDAWIERNAAELRHTLADPAIRAEVLALLGTDDSGRRRQRRLEEARRELAGLELRWRLEEEWEPSK